MNLVRIGFLMCCLGPLLSAAEKAGTLLEQAVENWLGERDNWAFTQRAVEYESGQPRERLERYDPSKPGNQRWTLLAINGHSPTQDEQAAWEKKKFKKTRRRIETPIGDFFDFREARVLSEDRKVVQYEVPLRREKQWLFETDKVRVRVTVNKETHALEHLSASMTEPVKVLLGLARITDGNLDLRFNADDDPTPGPDSAQPTGSATVKVSKFGERAEFTWTDFKRVGTGSRAAVEGEAEGDAFAQARR